MPNVKYNVRDFFDVRLISKIYSVHRYLHRIAYGDQKPVKTRLFADPNNIFAHALQDHYCLTLIECPFEFNFESLLSHFGWFCQFMYFNFSETTLQFDILKRLKDKDLSQEEVNLLLDILEKNPEPYQFQLNTFQDKAKFSLLKRQNLGENGSVTPFVERDNKFRQIFKVALKNHHLENEHGRRVGQVLISDKTPAQPFYTAGGNDKQSNEFAVKKYEPSLYGYLKLNENLNIDQQATIIHYLYDLLKDLFFKECSFKEFEAIFIYEQSEAIVLDISKPTNYHLDTQKLHWVFRSLKDSKKIISASWDIIRKKIIVYNKQGHIVQSVYQISESKIPSQKRRQVEKLLQPLFDKLPDFLPR